MRTRNVAAKILVGLMFSMILPLNSHLYAEVEMDLQVQDSLPPDLQAAFDHLKDAQTLESAHVGDSGALSENLKQLRNLLTSEKAETLLLQLYESGTLPAKLYAIIGLQLLQKIELAQSLIDDAFQFQFEEVDTLEGCILYERNVGYLLKKIAEGDYMKDFGQSPDGQK